MGKLSLPLNPGVPNFLELMPDDLRWSLCNNNRNEVHNKCKALESSWNHPPAHPIEKLSSMKQVPGAQSVGDCCFKLLLCLPWILSSVLKLGRYRACGSVECSPTLALKLEEERHDPRSFLILEIAFNWCLENLPITQMVSSLLELLRGTWPSWHLYFRPVLYFCLM